MQNLIIHSTATKNSPIDTALELTQLESILAERRIELSILQEEFQDFKARYTQIVGSRLAELAEVEQEIKEAAERTLGLESEEDEDNKETSTFDDKKDLSKLQVKTKLRKLFWSVARMFHPDHAADEEEARRRHTIMAEASRAYQEGDVESLHTLLGDEDLQLYCTSGFSDDKDEDLATRLLNLKDELRTVEFGIKRIKQDTLYRLKVNADEESKQGRDLLVDMAERINRQIAKARHKLEHFSY